MDLNYEIIFAIASIVDMYSIYKFLNVFLGDLVKNKSMLSVVYVFFYFITTMTHLFINIPLSMLACNVIGLFIITANYQYSFRKKVLSVIFICLILIGIETAVVLVSGYKNLSLFEQGNYGSIVGIVLIKLLTYVLALVLDKFKGIRNGREVPTSYWFCILIVPFSSIFVMLQTLNFKMLTYNMLTVEMILFLIINFFVFYLYDCLVVKMTESSERQMQLQEQRSYLKQYELMKTSVDSINGLKHDLKNHLITMQMLSTQKAYLELNRYIESLLCIPVFQNQYIETKNTTIDNILNYKIFEAEKFGIKVDTHITVPSTLVLDPYDFAVILGNLMDNAIEASVSHIVYVNMCYDKGCMSLRISNDFDGERVLNKDGYLLTTKRECANHGLGLKNVERVVEKYNGVMKIEIKEKDFTIYIMLYID